MKKISSKVLSYVLLIIAVLALAFSIKARLAGWFSGEKKALFTASTLVKTVNISELSTAKFMYKGIAPVYDESGKLKCHIRYKAEVKAGINMEAIDFKIDNDKKTVMPIMPEIEITSNIVDEEELAYIPQKADIEVKEALQACKEDVEKEANNASELKSVAKKNLQGTIEALIFPVIESSGYTIVWE